jgi:hypothetical protein
MKEYIITTKPIQDYVGKKNHYALNLQNFSKKVFSTNEVQRVNHSFEKKLVEKVQKNLVEFIVPTSIDDIKEIFDDFIKEISKEALSKVNKGNLQNLQTYFLLWIKELIEEALSWQVDDMNSDWKEIVKNEGIKVNSKPISDYVNEVEFKYGLPKDYEQYVTLLGITDESYEKISENWGKELKKQVIEKTKGKQFVSTHIQDIEYMFEDFISEKSKRTSDEYKSDLLLYMTEYQYKPDEFQIRNFENWKSYFLLKIKEIIDDAFRCQVRDAILDWSELEEKNSKDYRQRDRDFEDMGF